MATADRIGSLARNGYGWTRSTLDGPVATINVTTLGLHTLNLWMREDGAIVDKVLLTTSSAYRPTGFGPAESPRTDGSTPPAIRSVPIRRRNAPRAGASRRAAQADLAALLVAPDPAEIAPLDASRPLFTPTTTVPTGPLRRAHARAGPDRS